LTRRQGKTIRGRMRRPDFAGYGAQKPHEKGSGGDSRRLLHGRRNCPYLGAGAGMPEA
jgi:hypothetical protein